MVAHMVTVWLFCGHRVSSPLSQIMSTFIDPIHALGAAGGHFVVAFVAALLVLKTYESHWVLSTITGITLTVGVIAAEWRFLDPYFNPSLTVFKQAIVISIASALVGVILVMVLFEPETGQDNDDGNNGNNRFYRPPGLGGSSTDEHEGPEIPGGLED